jgi:hypothetical protein
MPARLEWHGEKAKIAIQAASKKAVVVACEHMRDKLVQTLSGQRSGRRYKVPGTNVTYTASAPGEAPASRTGRLRQSIGSRVVEVPNGVEGEVGTNLDYGLELERGTQRIRPRPWLAPTFEREQENVKDLIQKWNL